MEVNLPRFIAAIGRTHTPSELADRIPQRQISMIQSLFHKLSQEQVGAAKHIFLEAANFKKVVRDGIQTYYVNSSKRLVQYDPTFRVTKTRINQWNSVTADNNKLSFSDLETRYLMLHEVQIHVKSCSGTTLSCSCPAYCNNGYICSHILAVLHLEKILDIRHLNSLLEPVRGQRNN